MICEECGVQLTVDEEYYLAGRCNQCELDWHESIKVWREGGSNTHFDKIYSAPEVIKH